MSRIRDKDDPQGYNANPEHCKDCVEFIEVKKDPEYRCAWTFTTVQPMGVCPCAPSHYKEVEQKKPYLTIIDTRTGKTYTTDLQQLCIDAGLSDRLTYCDIECLLTDGETWYMLDECGNWAYLPACYKVEEVR